MNPGEQKRTVVLQGLGVSSGVAIGVAHLVRRIDAPISRYQIEDKSLVPEEIRRFRKAIKDSENQLLEIKRKFKDQEGLETLYILDVHIMILKDKMLVRQTIQNIEEKGVNAEWALRMTLDKYRDVFSKVDDEYLRERISDVEYAGQRILRNLAGVHHESISGIGDNAIIIASDLSPADTMQMKVENADRVMPAVVSITSTEVYKESERPTQVNPFDFFFPDPHHTPNQAPDEEHQEGGGLPDAGEPGGLFAAADEIHLPQVGQVAQQQIAGEHYASQHPNGKRNAQERSPRDRQELLGKAGGRRLARGHQHHSAQQAHRAQRGDERVDLQPRDQRAVGQDRSGVPAHALDAGVAGLLLRAERRDVDAVARDVLRGSEQARQAEQEEKRRKPAA